MTTSTYNTADDPDDPSDDGDIYLPGGIAGGGLVRGGEGSFYYAFTIDIGNLTDEYNLHFDLYNTQEGKRGTGDIDIKAFAPFSHDAETRRVPEPATMYLFGIGMIVLVGLRRRMG